MIKSELIKISAKLLTKQVSANRDDYPKNVPNWVLECIRNHNEMLRKQAVKLRSLADVL